MQPRTFSLRYRPQIFEELFDQEHIKRTLINAIERSKLAHAYLFTGPRGVGKTTTARILAKSLNCEKGQGAHPCNQCSACIEITASKSMDVLEIDGASNRGIDQIRDLRENIRYLPTGGRYRIYIIDEVHMLTTEAFNALLKTLEEPPRHVIFVFATTEPHKVPATILSRCQRFDFKRIPAHVIAERLSMIIAKENLDLDKDAIALISEIADGGLRDAESVLEQITTFKEGRITALDVTELLGIVPQERFVGFLKVLRGGSEKEILLFLEEIFKQGYDVAEYYFGLIRFIRSLLLYRLGINKDDFGVLGSEALSEAENHHPKNLAKILERFLRAEEVFKKSLEKTILIETISLSLLYTDNEQNQAHQKINPPQTPRSNPSPVKEEPETDTPSGSKETSKQEHETEKGEQLATKKEEPGKPSSLSSLWKSFLVELSQEQSFLTLALNSSALLQENENTLHIGITGSKFNLDIIEHDKNDLERRFSEIANRRVRLVFEILEKEEEKTDAKKTENTSVDDILDIFKGEIIR